MPEIRAGEPTPSDPVSGIFRDSIEEILLGFVDRQQTSLAALGDDIAPLFDAARQAVTGGKRLRPAFAYWGWRAADGSAGKTEALMRAAAAIELVHASALVHDDVMDDSDTRRGARSAHRAFAAQLAGAEPDTARHFGESAALLLGDMMLAWSDEMLLDSGFKDGPLHRARPYFDRLRDEVVAGQYLDVLAQASRRSSPSDAMRVARYKSAKYTVERPLQLGAALAKADSGLLSALSRYGIPLGEAFQLRDDVLGVFGVSSETGKPSGDDIREGKRTLLLARALGRADRRQTAVLDRQVGNARIDAVGISAVQEIMRETGALAAIETVISELTSAALAALRDAPLEDGSARMALATLAHHATTRSV